MTSLMTCENVSNPDSLVFRNLKAHKNPHHCDVLIDSLAQSIGELWPIIASKATTVAFAVFKGY